MKHTPGPWNAEKTGRDWFVTAEAPGLCVQVTNGRSNKTDGANADLIAAAPDLLDGLFHVMHSNHGYYPSACSACAAAGAALEKAGKK